VTEPSLELGASVGAPRGVAASTAEVPLPSLGAASVDVGVSPSVPVQNAPGGHSEAGAGSFARAWCTVPIEATTPVATATHAREPRLPGLPLRNFVAIR
jgi:hypothetical protein